MLGEDIWTGGLLLLFVLFTFWSISFRSQGAKFHVDEASPGGSVVKNLSASVGDPGSIFGREDPLEEEMTTHSNILA